MNSGLSPGDPMLVAAFRSALLRQGAIALITIVLLWLIWATARGTWSRLAGVASVAWGLVVWVFGESFGGIFAPGQSWLTGAPGGVLFYVAAGALIALPEQAWRGPRFGRLLLAGLGVFFARMAVLQAWPGRGYWQGTVNGKPGTLPGMVREMSGTPQPHVLSALLAHFASFATSNGFAVNLVVVIALAAAFLAGRPRVVRWAVWFGIAFGLADWVLVQDLGFLGGLGTDPNSMIPLILLFSAGMIEVSGAGVANEVIGTGEAQAAGGPGTGAGMIGRLRLGGLRDAGPGAAGPVTISRVRALGFGPGGSAWLLLGGGRAESIGGPSRAWRALPRVPAGTSTLAPGTGGSYDALAAAGSRLTVWRLGAGAWARVQQITVPVQFGSSG